jgi:CrcB protein
LGLADLLIDAVLVAAGAAVGTPARFFIGGVIDRRFGETFPWGTLVVNVSGCVVMGVLAAWMLLHGLSASAKLWVLAGTGFLGSYTTVSSFALQTQNLVRDGERRAGAGYIGLSVVLCLAAVAIGYAAGLHVLAGTRP